MKPPLSLALVAVRLFLVALAAAFAAFFAPATLLRSVLAAAAPDGQIEFLTDARLLGLRLAAGTALAGLALLFWASSRWRAKLELGANRLAGAFRRLAAELANELRQLALNRTALTICLIGFGLRLANLGVPMRHDEAKTFFAFVARPLIDGLSNYYVPNNHILHTLLAHISWRLFGDAPEVLRLPALLAGCLVLPLTYLAGRRLFGKRSATWATALVAICPPLVDYSTDARGYSLVAAATLAAFWLLVGRTSQPAAWAVAALCGALGLFAVPVMVVPLGALGLHRMLVAPGAQRGLVLRRLILAGAAAGTLAVLLYVPAMLRSGPAALFANEYVKALPLGQVLQGLPGLLSAQVVFLTGGFWPAAVLLLPLAALMLPAARRFRRARKLVAAILLAAVGLALLQRVLPPERAWLALAPLLALAVARAGCELALLLVRLPRQRAAFAAPLFAALLAAVQLAAGHTSANEECPEAASFAKVILASPQPGALVVTATPAAGPLRFYLLRENFPAERFKWVTRPPAPSSLPAPLPAPLPTDVPLYLVIRRGSFNTAELGLPSDQKLETLAEGATSTLLFRPAL